MKAWPVIWHHRHGTSAWVEFADDQPDPEIIAAGLEDFEPERDEWIEIGDGYDLPESELLAAAKFALTWFAANGYCGGGAHPEARLSKAVASAEGRKLFSVIVTGKPTDDDDVRVPGIYPIPGIDADDALDRFHRTVPIACLDDFEITVREVAP